MCMQLKILDLVKSVVDTTGTRLSLKQVAAFKDVLEHAGALSATAGECPGVEECPCAEGDGIARFYGYLDQLGITLTMSRHVSRAPA